MFKSISMAQRPGLQLVQEGLATEECPKEHFNKSIIQISMFSFHQSSSFSSKFKFFIRVQGFHQSSSFSSKFKFFIKVHKMLVSNVDLKKCQIHKILVSRVDFSKCQVFKIMDFLKCSRASQWHCVPGCILCKRVSPKRNAPKNILKNPLFKVQYGFKFQDFQKFKFFSKVQVCPKFRFFQS